VVCYLEYPSSAHQQTAILTSPSVIDVLCVKLFSCAHQKSKTFHTEAQSKVTRLRNVAEQSVGNKYVKCMFPRRVQLIRVARLAREGFCNFQSRNPGIEPHSIPGFRINKIYLFNGLLVLCIYSFFDAFLMQSLQWGGEGAVVLGPTCDRVSGAQKLISEFRTFACV